jgi:two-component system, LytTR family, sensor kinase
VFCSNGWLTGSTPVAIAEAFALPFTFAIIGASIWYVIKYSTLENYSPGGCYSFTPYCSYHHCFYLALPGCCNYKLLHPYSEQWIDNNLAANIFGGYMLYLTYVIFFYAVNYYQGFKEKLVMKANLKSLVKEAELHALKSQINPTFCLTA